MRKKSSRRGVRRTAAEIQADLQAAAQLESAGHWPEAEQRCRAVIAVQPASPFALHILARAVWRQHRRDEAEGLLRQALAIDPDYHGAAIDLANFSSESGKPAAADQLLTYVVKKCPDHVLALNNLGVLRKEQGQWMEAVDLLCRASALEPKYLDAHLNRGYAHIQGEQWTEAASAFECALRLDPDHLEAIRVLIRLYRIQARNSDLPALYQRWQQLAPTDSTPAYLLRALQGDRELSRAPQDYVRDEFERFADSFDAQLRLLEYQVHEVVAREFHQHFPQADGTRVVADLGCGTGLAGVWLRPYSQALIGVDLSAKMLAKAAERHLYDQLVQAELVEFLVAQPGAFDWVVALDTLNYLGDLQPTLTHAHAALRPGGVLAFTIETAETPDDDFRVTPSGRYRHGAGYVQELLAAAGFTRQRTTSAILRKEAGAPVEGLVIWAEKLLHATTSASAP